jgi:hypothetical protein
MKGFLHVIQLERFNDCFNLFHGAGQPFAVSLQPSIIVPTKGAQANAQFRQVAVWNLGRARVICPFIRQQPPEN